MTNSNWKPVPHSHVCPTDDYSLMPCRCSGTRWHGYGERVGDFAAVWALTGWLAGLKPEQRPFGFLHVYPEGYDFTLESPDYDDPEAIVRPLYAAPVPPAAAQHDILKQATGYAHDIVTWLHRDHYSDNTTFEPFDDLLGLLSQIDNMICGWKDHAAQPVANQCDGCARGIIVDDDGIHRAASGHPVMVCQAHPAAAQTVVLRENGGCINCMRLD